MIRLHFMLWLLALGISSFSMAQKIDGIGPFRLKIADVSVMDSFAKKEGATLTEARTPEAFSRARNKRGAVIEVFADTAQTTKPVGRASYCADVRVFYIPSFAVAGIALKETYLTFYKGRLAEIYTRNTDAVVEALQTKYGKPVTETETTKTSCTGLFSDKPTELENTMTYHKWTNGDIVAVAADGNMRDEKCNMQRRSYIAITATPLMKTVEDCNAKEKAAIEAALKARRKDALKDF